MTSAANVFAICRPASGPRSATNPEARANRKSPVRIATELSQRAFALVAPALVVVALFFVLPLGLSAIGAFRASDGSFTLAHFAKSLDLYGRDLVFTVVMVGISTVLIALVSIAIAGYLTLGENPRWSVPVLDFTGVPTGIDVTRVCRTGILPQINTGMAGKVAGVGQVGAGLVTPPAEIFPKALAALAARAGQVEEAGRSL